jgi:hypothetical protein
MSQLSPERRKVAVLGGSIAALSGSVLLLQRNHHWLTVVWLAVLIVALAYVGMQLVKIQRSKKQ